MALEAAADGERNGQAHQGYQAQKSVEQQQAVPTPVPNSASPGEAPGQQQGRQAHQPELSIDGAERSGRSVTFVEPAAAARTASASGGGHGAPSAPAPLPPNGCTGRLPSIGSRSSSGTSSLRQSSSPALSLNSQTRRQFRMAQRRGLPSSFVTLQASLPQDVAAIPLVNTRVRGRAGWPH